MGAVLCWGSDEAPNDLLSLKAEKTGRIVSTPLMDVATAGDRLVVVGEGGRIAYSDDLGATWTQAEVPVSVTLTAVHFPTSDRGWAVGHDGVILTTGDGGRSWQKQLDGNRVNKLILSQVKALIARTEEALDSASEEEREALEVRLDDLGFFLSDAEMAVREGPTRPLMDVWFGDERNGLAVGAFGMIFQTSDGGANWESILERMDNPDGFHYYAVTSSGGNLYVVGERGMIFRSPDGGKSWERLESPYKGSFFGIYGHPSGDYLLVFGLGGDAFRSTDSGDNWQRVNKPESSAISASALTADGDILMTAYDGTSMLSADGGQSFHPVSERFPGCIAMNRMSNGSILLVGLRGMHIAEGIGRERQGK